MLVVMGKNNLKQRRYYSVHTIFQNYIPLELVWNNVTAAISTQVYKRKYYFPPEPKFAPIILAGVLV